MSQKLNCIMLIDDDEPTNFLTKMIIEEAHCTKHLQITDSGERAVNYLANSKEFVYSKEYPWPELIFLDINMPAMNGWEFLDKYKELGKEHKNNVVIIMLTTSLSRADELRAKGLPGITCFKHKPLTKEMLNEILQKYFYLNERSGFNVNAG